jgi:internalin A
MGIFDFLSKKSLSKYELKYKEAERKYFQNDYESAIVELKALLLEYPHYQCYGLIGSCYFGLKKYDEALSYYKKSIEKESSYEKNSMVFNRIEEVDKKLLKQKNAVKTNPKEAINILKNNRFSELNSILKSMKVDFFKVNTPSTASNEVASAFHYLPFENEEINELMSNNFLALESRFAILNKNRIFDNLLTIGKFVFLEKHSNKFNEDIEYSNSAIKMCLHFLVDASYSSQDYHSCILYGEKLLNEIEHNSDSTFDPDKKDILIALSMAYGKISQYEKSDYYGFLANKKTEPKKNIEDKLISSKIDEWDWWNNLTKQWQQIFRSEIDSFSENELTEEELRMILDLTSLKHYEQQDLMDVSPLMELTKLTELDLHWNQITDISPLMKLTNLTSLKLNGNKITDISPLMQLTNLTELNLNNNQITDISALKKLTNLVKLDLRGNQITDVSPLMELSILTELWLCENRITDISPLMELTNLVSLHAWKNKITDISALKGLTSLTTIDLKFNQITYIYALKGLTSLTSLNLNGNQITDISPLMELTNLNDLSLYSNKITDITPLQKLTKLTSLPLWDNQITDITPLKELPNLYHLDLYRNQIKDISPLKELTKLVSLNLTENQIIDFSPLNELKKSQKCSVNY